MKRDRDDTDFRGVGEGYQQREQGCTFRELPKDHMVGEAELAYAVHDVFPVAPLHTLVIPKRHVQGSSSSLARSSTPATVSWSKRNERYNERMEASKGSTSAQTTAKSQDRPFFAATCI